MQTEDKMKNPKGPKDGSRRVIRGGSWFSGTQNLRSAYRYYAEPGDRDVLVGFRLVRVKQLISINNNPS
jgi:sulfatase modifying factor 1